MTSANGHAIINILLHNNRFAGVLVGIVIALEKLIPRGELVARISGTFSILGGLALAAKSLLGGHLGL